MPSANDLQKRVAGEMFGFVSKGIAEPERTIAKEPVKEAEQVTGQVTVSKPVKETVVSVRKSRRGPRPRYGDNPCRTTVTMKNDLYERLLEYIDRKGMSINFFINRVVEEKLDALEDEGK